MVKEFVEAALTRAVDKLCACGSRDWRGGGVCPACGVLELVEEKYSKPWFNAWAVIHEGEIDTCGPSNLYGVHYMGLYDMLADGVLEADLDDFWHEQHQESFKENGVAYFEVSILEWEDHEGGPEGGPFMSWEVDMRLTGFEPEGESMKEISDA